MLVKKLSTEELQNLNNYNYKSTNKSIVYNYLVSPLLNKVVVLLPMKLAPNLITFFSLCCNIIAFLFALADGGFDFSENLRGSTCFVLGLGQLLYIFFDNIDGKQARRTKTSGPFGMLMDHGCDIFTTIFTAFNFSKLLKIGNTGILSFAVIVSLYFGFHLMTYEEYVCHELHLGVINGADEGNFAFTLFAFLLSMTGQNWLDYKIIENMNITISVLIQIGLIIGTLTVVYNLYLHSYQKIGIRSLLYIPLENLLFLNVLLFPLFSCIFQNEFYNNYRIIIIIAISLLFARITMELQITIITLSKIKFNKNVIIYNIIILASFFMPNVPIKVLLLIILIGTQSIELIMFIYVRANEILTFLNRKLFTIDLPELVEENQNKDVVPIENTPPSI